MLTLPNVTIEVWALATNYIRAILIWKQSFQYGTLEEETCRVLYERYEEIFKLEQW
jgi:hypothetical protein